MCQRDDELFGELHDLCPVSFDSPHDLKGGELYIRQPIETLPATTKVLTSVICLAVTFSSRRKTVWTS